MGENASGGGFRLKQNSNCVAQTAFKMIITMDNRKGELYSFVGSWLPELVCSLGFKGQA